MDEDVFTTLFKKIWQRNLPFPQVFYISHEFLCEGWSTNSMPCIPKARGLNMAFPPHSRTKSHPQTLHHTEVQGFTGEGTNPTPVVPPTAGCSVLRGKSVNQFCSHTQSIEWNNGNKTSFWDESILHYQDMSPQQLIFINNGSRTLQ